MSSRLIIVKDELLQAWLAPTIGKEYENLLVFKVFTNQACLKQLGRVWVNGNKIMKINIYLEGDQRINPNHLKQT